MKKTTLLFFVIALFISVTGNAEVLTGSCGENLTYTLDTESGVLKIDGSGEMKDYDYSSTPWYSKRENILKVELPDGLTSIGSNAFYYCSGITSVNIPKSVTSIGERAFDCCSGLTSITIPNSVTSIGDYAFADCSGLTSITIPNSVTNIGSGAFMGCSNLTSITIPSSVTSIGENLFFFTNLTKLNYNAKNATVFSSSFPNTITTLNIGNEVESIPSYFVGNCSGLTSITIPNSVTSIGDEAFHGCSGLTDINIPNSVTNIGNAAFSGCSGLTSITIPNSVTSIGDYAFRGCSSIKSFVVDADNSNYCTDNNILYNKDKTTLIYCIPTFEGEVTIPNSVTSIGDYAFADCSGITSITIPNSITSIGNGAFDDCSGLTSITIPNTITSIGNGAFEGCSGLTSISIPNSVTSIGEFAFYGCSGLTSITIPNSVTSIGGWAFHSCYGLTSITIPNSVTSIGDYAFCWCSGLTSITIPNSVTSIGSSAFWYCPNLTSITIPNSVTSIGEGAFLDCSGLTEIHSNSITPPTCTNSTFYKVNTATCKLYVPTGSKEAYASADVWKQFVNIIEEDIINTDSKIGKPTISYENSALKFTSSTPGVKFIYSIQAEDATPTLTDVQDDEVKLSATYIITAYAKTESATSEPATATLVWVDAKLTTDGESTEVQTVEARPILINSNDGKVTITGLEDNEIVDVYSLSGSKLCTATSALGSASFNSTPNEVIIVKVGDRSLKVNVK